MKLSEAMRLGAMTGPQAFGVFEKDDARCALAAAVHAGGCTETRRVADYPERGLRGYVSPGTIIVNYTVPPEWETLIRQHVACPRCHGISSMVAVIVHLNDDHCLTREEIAAWVEEVENKLTACAPPVAVLERVMAKPSQELEPV